jgi:hypothetical protein
MTQITAPRIEGVKPFPGQSDNPRVAMGGNEPPLDQRIVGEFNEAIDEEPGLRTRINEIIAKGKMLPVCTDDETAGKLGDFMRMASTAIAKVDTFHVTIKAPYLAATRAIDLAKRNTVDALGDAKSCALNNLNAYQAEINRKQRIEQKRIDDEQAAMRAAEAERVRIANEAILAENARRRAAEAEDRPFSSSTDFATIPLISEPEPIPEPVAAPVAAAPVIRGDYGARIGTKTVWKHVVEDVKKLPKALLEHPKVLEAISSVISGQIRGGIRELKGVRIWDEQEISVR